MFFFRRKITIFWRWSFENYLQGWPGNIKHYLIYLIFQISASQVARIMGMSHQCLTTAFSKTK
jgi:hypothetical protein